MKPNPPESWAVARVLAGAEVTSVADTLRPPWEAVVALLAGLPSEYRQPAWETFLAGQEDADAIVEAVARADPADDPPEADATDESEPGPRYVLTCMADVVPRPVDWLWHERVPRGMLTLFAGDPKLGKSFVTVQMAADVSRGAPLPHDPTAPDGPGSVLIMSAEDDQARTIRPRLDSAGADVSRVHHLTSVILSGGREALPSLRTDMEIIEEAAVRLKDCRLIVIDPVSAFLNGADDHKNGDLRGLLSPLKALAERTDAAVVLISHLNKGNASNGKYRVSGSIAYVGACRANFLFAKDPDDPEGRRVLMLPNGCNLAAEPPALAYRVNVGPDGARVEWEADAIPMSADDVLRAEAAGGDARAEQADALSWLRAELAAGPMPVKDVFKSGKEAAFTENAIRKAAAAARVRKRKDGFGPGAPWLWSLPESSA
jgi:putative DNA primase/helicase